MAFATDATAALNTKATTCLFSTVLTLDRPVSKLQNTLARVLIIRRKCRHRPSFIALAESNVVGTGAE